jgi:hypothetical protein
MLSSERKYVKNFIELLLLLIPRSEIQSKLNGTVIINFL